ncbi:VWA domain-containing protein, partial [Candidatus Woesebacteria bacterium]|nr:VWA domain-containing protein [Candidatus Woesebacteria bacterium]
SMPGSIPKGTEAESGQGQGSDSDTKPNPDSELSPDSDGNERGGNTESEATNQNEQPADQEMKPEDAFNKNDGEQGKQGDDLESLIEKAQELLAQLQQEQGQGEQSSQDGQSSDDDGQQLQDQSQSQQQQSESGDAGTSGAEQKANGEQTQANSSPGSQDGGNDGSSGMVGQPNGNEESQSDAKTEWQQGGAINNRDTSEMFTDVPEKLLDQLQSLTKKVGSEFHESTGEDEIQMKMDTNAVELVAQQQNAADTTTREILEGELDQIKRNHQEQLRRTYSQLSGLEGKALDTYIEYSLAMSDFTKEVIDFFVERFELDQKYRNIRNQTRGSRVQKGWQRKIMGTRSGEVLLDPSIFERRKRNVRPNIVWTLIIDNSGSCHGEIMDEQKKLVVALIEAAKDKRLNIPLEVLTFGGEEGYVFLKTHDQDVRGSELEKIVLLKADQGTPDVATLNAACASMNRYTAGMNPVYPFIYFMTDGESAEGSIQEILTKNRRNMVLTGIGLGSAADTINETWGKNGLAVKKVSELKRLFFDHLQRQIDEVY